MMVELGEMIIDLSAMNVEIIQAVTVKTDKRVKKSV